MLTTEANWSKVYKLNPLCSHSHLCVRNKHNGIRSPQKPEQRNYQIQGQKCNSVFHLFNCQLHVSVRFSGVYFSNLDTRILVYTWNSYCPCVTCDKHNVPPYRVQTLRQISRNLFNHPVHSQSGQCILLLVHCISLLKTMTEN